jgi:hypothetical protein
LTGGKRQGKPEGLKKKLDQTPNAMAGHWSAGAFRGSRSDNRCTQVGGSSVSCVNVSGTERVLYLFDDPGLVEDIMDTLLFMEIEIIKRATKDIKFEIATYWEDMAYKSGPLISPNMVRKFMMPRYKKLNDLLHSNGVDVIFVDSDGNLDLLIPLWLECGVNFVWP